MKKIFYLLSFALDMVILPFLMLGGYFIAIILAMYNSIKSKTNILSNIYLNLKDVTYMMIILIIDGLKVHKERIIKEES